MPSPVRNDKYIVLFELIRPLPKLHLASALCDDENAAFSRAIRHRAEPKAQQLKKRCNRRQYVVAIKRIGIFELDAMHVVPVATPATLVQSLPRSTLRKSNQRGLDAGP